MNISRSCQKRITKEAIILRYMRHNKKLSLRVAGQKIGISGSAIAHIEGGRMDVSRKRIETMVEVYGFTMEDYLSYFDRQELPIDVRDECVGIVKQLDESKLQAVYAVLVNFMPAGSTRTHQSPPRFSGLSKS